MTHDCPRKRGLARARFAHQAQHLPGLDRQRHVLQHALRATMRQVVERIVADLQDGAHRSSRGFSASRRPSPRRLKQIAVVAMASAGATMIHGAWCMKRRASDTIRPHSDAGGWAPRPRKESVANSMTAKATRIVASMIRGAATLGSISRSTTQPAPSPRAIAAFTKSCWRTEGATERVPRAMPGATEIA